MRYASRGLRRRRDTDKWEVTLSSKDPMTGELISSYYTVTAKTETQAKKKRDELILQLERKGGASASDMTIRELVESLIQFKEEGGEIERSTADYYRKDLRVICRYIGGIRVADLDIPTVQKWLASMSGDGLAPRSIAKPFRLLKQSMKYAMALDLVTKNPCDYCKPPKVSRKTVNVLSSEERRRMHQLVRDSLHVPICLAIEFALTTGMRRGEICGLRWSDLHEDGTISVNRAIGEVRGGTYVKSPKTRESLRTIPLEPGFFAQLCAMRKDAFNVAKKFKIQLGDPYILGTQEPESKPYLPNRLTREFKSFCDTHDFDCGFHDLRHTFATMLISAGVDIRTVADYLGHANVAVTLNTYAEPETEAKWNALKKISAALGVDSCSSEIKF